MRQTATLASVFAKPKNYKLQSAGKAIMDCRVKPGNDNEVCVAAAGGSVPYFQE
jgi:hypothetical protein